MTMAEKKHSLYKITYKTTKHHTTRVGTGKKPSENESASSGD
jgi:hypothetical protein